MKLLILILCIALLRSQTLGGYENIDIDQAQSDPQIQSLIDAGLQTIIADGIRTNQVENSNYELSKIYNIMRRQADGEDYRFNCDFTNDEGYTLKANFDVNYKEDTDETTVTEFTYKVEKQSLIQNVESQYTQVKYPEFENSQEMQDLAVYGVDEMIKKCIENEYLPDQNYRVSSINWIYRQVYENAIFYKCNVDMTGDGIEMNANFTVYYQPLTDDKTVVDYSCDIKSEQYGDKDVYVTTSSVAPIESHYSPIPDREVENNDAVKDALDYGSQQITKIAIDEGKIPQTDLEVLEVKNAVSQVVGNGVYYKFWCTLGDKQTVTVRTNYTVYYDVYSTEKNLASYWYESEIIEQQAEEEENNEEVFIGDDEGEFLPNDIEFVDLEEEEEFQVEVEEEPGKGGLSIFDQVFPLPEDQEEELEEEVFIDDEEQEIFVDNPVLEEEDLEAPVEENEQVVVDEEEQGEGTRDYKPIDTDTVQSDAKTSSAFQYGVDKVTENGKSESKIPDYEYTVNSIYEAATKSDDKGDYYRFQCEATSTEGSTLWLTFTTYYDYDTQETSLLTYTYRVKNTDSGKSTTPIISPEGNYVPCTQDEISSSNIIQGALDYGVSQIYGYVEQQRDVPTSGYEVKEVNSVDKLETVTGTSYKCDVVLANDEGSEISAKYTVYYDSTSQQYSLSDYSYDIDEEETEGASEEALNDDEDLYKDVDLSYLDLDEEYRQMLLYAIDAVIQKGYEETKIPQSEYKISKINYVKKRGGEDGENYYKCDVELQDINKITIKVKFTGSIKITDNYKKLWEWNYSVTDMITIPVKDTQVPEAGYTKVNTDEVEYNTEIQDCIMYGVEQIVPNPQDYALSQIKSVYRQVIDSAIYYKYDIELAGNKKSAQLSCTVYYNPESDVKDIWAYSYRTQSSTSPTTPGSEFSWWDSSSFESSSSSSSDWNSDANYNSIDSYKYQKLDVSEVDTNAKYKDILDYGVQQCVQNLQDNKIVADNNYEVEEIEEAYVQENDDYENCKMKVKLTNPAGIALNLNFNVQYNPQEKTVTSYSVYGTSSGQSQVLAADYNIEDGGQLDIGNCDKVYPKDNAYPSYVQDAIDYGANQVTEQVVEKENMQYADYEVKDVKNVYQEVVNPTYYRVEATLENSQGSTIDCNYLVNYEPSTNTKEVKSYSYITY